MYLFYLDQSSIENEGGIILYFLTDHFPPLLPSAKVIKVDYSY